MALREESLDAVAAGTGAGASIWNFILGGGFNTLLGTIIGVLSIAVLIQRWRINRKTLR
jgi:predicted ABC-type sugar transport system permease subunit